MQQDDASAANTARTPARRAAIGYFLRNGPLAIVSASLPGLVNYVIVVYLSYAHGLAAAGEYRLLFSYFALAGLPTLQESNSVYIRAATLGSREQMAGLVAGQIYASALTAIVMVLAVLGSQAMGQDWAPAVLLPIAAVTFLYYPFQLFIAHLQARQQFARLFALTIAKWGAAILVFFAVLWSGGTVMQATLVQLGAMAVINVGYYAVVAVRQIRWSRDLLDPIRTFRRKEVRESVLLTTGLIPSGMLEQVDKLVVGAVFGLEALGIYTLGFSTGRLMYNMLKPSLYVYYKSFVDKMPPRRLLERVFVVFTLLGASIAVLFWVGVAYIPAMHRFHGAEPVATVLFLSYGVSIVDAIYSQAFAINKNTDSMHVFAGNMLSSLPCFILFAAATLMPVQIALVVFALFYPLRHGAAVLITSARRRRASRLASSV